MTGISRAFGFNAPYSFMYSDENDVSLFFSDDVAVAWSMFGFILPPDRQGFQAGDWRWCLGQNVRKFDEFFFHDTKVSFAGLGQPFYQSTAKECDEALSSQCNVHRHINGTLYCLKIA